MFRKQTDDVSLVSIYDVEEQELTYIKNNRLFPAGELEERALEYAALFTHTHPESKETLEESLESGYEQEVLFEAIKQGILQDSEKAFLEWYDENSAAIFKATERAMLLSREFSELVEETDGSRMSVFARIGAWFASNRARGKAYLNI